MCFFQTETSFLGRVVNSQGVGVNPENIEKVKRLKIGLFQDLSRSVKKFLGFLNYHREHIKDYAKITSVLYELTGSKASFVWQEKHLQQKEL